MASLLRLDSAAAQPFDVEFEHTKSSNFRFALRPAERLYGAFKTNLMHWPWFLKGPTGGPKFL